MLVSQSTPVRPLRLRSSVCAFFEIPCKLDGLFRTIHVEEALISAILQEVFPPGGKDGKSMVNDDYQQAASLPIEVNITFLPVNIN